MLKTVTVRNVDLQIGDNFPYDMAVLQYASLRVFYTPPGARHRNPLKKDQ